MFARMAYADPCAMMDQHLLVKRAHEIELLFKQRYRRLLTHREIMGEMPRKPGPALCAAPDHDGISAGLRKGRNGPLEIRYIAVDHDWDRHRPFHSADCGP